MGGLEDKWKGARWERDAKVLNTSSAQISQWRKSHVQGI